MSVLHYIGEKKTVATKCNKPNRDMSAGFFIVFLNMILSTSAELVCIS